MAYDEKKIHVDQVEPGSCALVQGIIGYSHVVTKVDGQELEDTKARRRLSGQIEPTRPYTTMTLHSVNVLFKDPQKPTTAEQYVHERCYTSKNSEKNPGWCYTGENKGIYLPAIGVRDGQGHFRQVYPTAELAPGQSVIMLVRFFKGKVHNGCTFDAVLVLADEVQTLGGSGNQLANELSQFGITWHSTPDPNAVPVEEDADQIGNTLSLEQAVHGQVPVQSAADFMNPPTAVGAMPMTAVSETNPAGIHYDPQDR